MAKSFEEGGGAGAAGTASELAVGFAIAQQMMQQSGLAGSASAGMPGVAAGAALAGAAAPAGTSAAHAGPPALLTPAEVGQALGVAESDVLAVLETGELKGKKIGTSWRVTRAALDAYLAE